jgi:hypothetical protein
VTDTERRFLGMIEVDSGTLLVGDPVYVLPRARDAKPGVDFQEVVDADASVYAPRIGGKPVLLLRRFGGDGPFPVFGKFVEMREPEGVEERLRDRLAEVGRSQRLMSYGELECMLKLDGDDPDDRCRAGEYLAMAFVIAELNRTHEYWAGH